MIPNLDYGAIELRLMASLLRARDNPIVAAANRGLARMYRGFKPTPLTPAELSLKEIYGL